MFTFTFLKQWQSYYESRKVRIKYNCLFSRRNVKTQLTEYLLFDPHAINPPTGQLCIGLTANGVSQKVRDASREKASI